LSKRGSHVTTEALAGTLPRTTAPLTELSAQLLSSDKDRREHELVVTAIQQRLGTLCSEVAAPTSPQIRVLPHLLHLHTPIHATTRASHTNIRELVAALHPTPAMGGTPSAPALQLIADYEPQPRGYYAGPVGWWDEQGDGEFAVAIRSGVITADTAYVYAGAGIVRGSDAALEYAETAAKMRTLLDALGISTTDFTETPR
jgi:isochorismate synthase